MANEMTITAGISQSNGNARYANKVSYQATQTTNNGPSPGSVTATTGGTTVSLAQLTTPGKVLFRNLDSTNYVRIGLYISSTFYPFMELLSGEAAVLTLSRDILTANTSAAVLRIVANTASVVVQVDCFDK